MTENEPRNRPRLWLVDSEQGQLGACRDAFEPWAECLHSVWNAPAPDWDNPPDAVFFSAEIPGGANGEFFAGLVENAGPVPLLAVARLRSLAQAVAYFRAGAADYLSLPLNADDARERFDASLDRAARLAMQGMVMEVEEEEDTDILAELRPVPPPPAPEPACHGPGTFVNDMPLLLEIPSREGKGGRPEDSAGESGEDFDADIPEDLIFADTTPDEEPVAVDGLPIPTLWEELPCGLLVFDSLGNLVFSNRLGLELLGRASLAELQDALENSLSAFAAHGANRKPLPDNQWPHLLAVKTRAPRSAVVSVRLDGARRSWLRIDCQPHLADGKIARLSMTVVNLTGELPPFQEQEGGETPPPPQRRDRAKRRGRKKG